MSQSPSPPSKLFIRSEVLAVIEYLCVVESPSKQERAKQIRRLSEINDQKTVLNILLKELKRTTAQSPLQAITELSMELGTIELLQEPLWVIIKNPETLDENKDAANLILRHLGDETDPDLYLEYLDDPQGLINRETERMLEVAARNPEALIDFIDFIFSLPVEEQVNLLSSLQADYSMDHLLNIYIPTFLAEPPTEVKELILKSLGSIRHMQSAVFLDDIQDDYEDNEAFSKLIKHAVNELRIAGIYKEEWLEGYREELAKPHTLLDDSAIYKCYVTLTDGIGNQGLIVSRKQHNGDVSMMSVAVNDLHGLIDCFGFYQLSDDDFIRISDKFHEESCKIQVSPAYCRRKLELAEALSAKNKNRIPYEYTCWKVLIEDFPDEPIDTMSLCREMAKPEWVVECANLYRHPDFETWFLEEGDHPVVTEILGDIVQLTHQAVQETWSDEKFMEVMNRYALGMAMALMTTEWRDIIIYRLADTAYLLNNEETKTFAALAATEVMKLISYEEEDEEKVLNIGFIRQYGRRCIEEQLLRLKNEAVTTKETTSINDLKTLNALADMVMAAWSIDSN